MPLLSMLNHVALVILDSVVEPATEELVSVSLPWLRVMRGSLRVLTALGALVCFRFWHAQETGWLRAPLFVCACVRARPLAGGADATTILCRSAFSGGSAGGDERVPLHAPAVHRHRIGTRRSSEVDGEYSPVPRWSSEFGQGTRAVRMRPPATPGNHPRLRF